MGVRLGGGVGPVRVSVGAPRVSKGCSQGCLSFVLIVGVVALISAWPWMLGTHIATKHGHPKGTRDYNLAGWIPEGAWIALILLVFVLVAVSGAKRNAALARQNAAVARQNAAAAEAARRQAIADEERVRRMRAADAEAAQLRAAEAERQRVALGEQRARMKLVDTPWYDPEAGHYTHSTCTIQHRSEGSALRCKSKV